jgi:hypothetical protein
MCLGKRVDLGVTLQAFLVDAGPNARQFVVEDGAVFVRFEPLGDAVREQLRGASMGGGNLKRDTYFP